MRPINSAGKYLRLIANRARPSQQLKRQGVRQFDVVSYLVRTTCREAVQIV